MNKWSKQAATREFLFLEDQLSRTICDRQDRYLTFLLQEELSRTDASTVLLNRIRIGLDRNILRCWLVCPRIWYGSVAEVVENESMLADIL